MDAGAASPSNIGPQRLLSQISPDNVLAVGAVLTQQAAAIRVALSTAKGCAVGPCGEDPISAIATPAFDDRYRQIVATHDAHQAELEDAAGRLRSIAVSYGLNENDIAKTFKS
ncbi:PE domain-containing protein [Pseudonocardia alni]|uniref:PE domain-containing protein n=1 Tax=Pseudonocardia alni TaxID=33907 RepID=UPI0033298668